ncbi:hypothetical protein [Oceanobacillus chungangensis]|uniref:Uncharacterized protein n=1 Tax=Oceanobacillus chungangensis TaxID=1229152 RepID=A0A3D8PUW7_9BACI|nr:hypothetical protein [Oceanobacillus chungangensis]RDW19906.1 hypothetical protein CWR45_07535 [Oceanobacillus chungangensis]
MKQIYAFEQKEDFDRYQGIIQRFSNKLKNYQKILEEQYALNDLPKGVIWTTPELATNAFSDIPIPAYTNKNLIYMSPDIAYWRKLFLQQLEGKQLPKVQYFYENYSEKELFIILAHELTHHSDLFLDGFEDDREDGIWFEEGMCFYLPRKLLLSEKEFDEITAVEMELVNTFNDKYGNHSIEAFGSSSYEGSLSSIMFDYWRSYLAVKHLVEVRAKNDLMSVFDQYRKWDQEGRKVSLVEYFELESFV